MKRIVLLITVVFWVSQVKAQYVYDEWGKVIPFSLQEEYKDEIEKYGVPVFAIPKMNNDSLCRKYNDGKSFHELGSDFTGGIDIKSKQIHIKKDGVCIQLKNGKLWRYSIEGESAGGIGFDLGFPKLQEGTYIAVFAPDTTYIKDPYKIYYSENLLKRHKKMGIRGGVSGKKLILEYYEPDSIKNKENIVIKNIYYDFVAFPGRDPSSYNKPALKSGFYGSSEFPDCQQDVECTLYKNEAKSVVFLYVKFLIDEDEDEYLETNYSKATGFFLNKSGGYEDSNSPVLVTAGHLYSYYKLDITPIDIDSYISEFRVVTKYQNSECGNDDIESKGILLDCSFNRIALGSSYDEGGLPFYSANKDYAVLQANSTVNNLSKYDLVYGAWTKNYNYNTGVGYICIHHPKGDSKKFNKDNDASYSVSTDGFKLKYDIGITEGGSSGAPVFNLSKEIVGFHVRGAVDKDCNLLGQISSTSGKFDYLYTEFSSILDPTGGGSAQSSNPQPPSYSELPDHCKNCEQDGDETGIDCGGGCYPCGMQDVMAIKTEMDLQGVNKSRYEIFAEPDPGSLLALKSGNSSLEAGMNVYLNGGFEVQKGATFYAGIDAELMSEADRGCQPACFAPNWAFSPNGDGVTDYWYFNQAFIQEYNIKIFSPDGKSIIYSDNGVPVFGNGTIYAWDGSGYNFTQSEQFPVTIDYLDCYGIWRSKNDWIWAGYSANKSAEIQSQNSLQEINTKNVDGKSDTGSIDLFPNPVTNQLNIQYSGDTFPLKYKLTDLNGKEIIMKETSTANEQVDLSGVSSGVYIIHAKAGDCNLIQKIIKK
ncbi:T9SS type A sorting domain-containing protein [Maribellus mangrovi]|uniref:T9SS type A sorting domain-containing protein n=1 Tax=Maribellus mangrovi TaxID=3133146 RepID=UPI0030EF2BEB